MLALRSFAPLVVLACLVFGTVTALMHPLFPAPLRLHAEYRDAKLDLIGREAGRAQVLLFGTSRVHEGFVPELFDRAAGAPRSLNLGLVGGSQTEQRVLAKEFLSRATPCSMVFEINAGLNLPPESRFDPRAVNLYDAETVRFVGAFNGEEIGLGRRAARLGFALLAAAGHYTHAGMLSSRMFQPHIETPEDGRRGQITLAQSEEERARVAASFAEKPAAPIITPENIAPGNRYLLNELAAQRPQLHFAYLVAPMLEDLTHAPDYPAQMDGPNGPVPILNLARPDRFPELYRPELWRNATHLSPEGARVFTQLLAQEWKRTGMTCGAQ